MLRESILEIARQEEGDWVASVDVQGADEHTDRKPPELESDIDEIAEFMRDERDSALGQVNWVAGGMLVFLNTADGVYIPVGWRDEAAPSYSEMLCTASGIADTKEDVLNPRLLGYREALEEILLYDTSSDQWLLPQDDSIEKSEKSVTTDIYELWEEKSNSKTSSETGVSTVDATVHRIGSDKFSVRSPEDSTVEETIGHFIIDMKTKNVDLVDAIVVDLPETSIEDIRLFDGEHIDGNLLNRDVYLFTPSEFASLFTGPTTAERAFSSGKVKTGTGVSNDFDEGEPITQSFTGVPTLAESHHELTAFLKEFEF